MKIRTFLRNQVGSTTDEMDGKFGKPVGWFSNRHNQAHGWAIYDLDVNDRIWFATQGEPVKGAFRIVSLTHKITSLVKFDLETQRVQFFDNEAYEADDKIHWQAKDHYLALHVDREFRDRFMVLGLNKYL